ncbi:MAG: 26S protease regulatory subunit, partial [Planctomycetota bacterium]
MPDCASARAQALRRICSVRGKACRVAVPHRRCYDFIGEQPAPAMLACLHARRTSAGSCVTFLAASPGGPGTAKDLSVMPAANNFDPVFAIVALAAIAFVLLVALISQKLTGWTKPTILKDFQRFFGKDLERLETHDKNFPGYDLASISLALASLGEDCCTTFQEVGATHVYITTMRMLLDTIEALLTRNLKPTAPTYQRVPVDVNEEASFPNSAIYLAVLGPKAAGDKIAILVAAHSTHDSWDGMDTQNTPRQQITVSIACGTRAVADRFFTELEERRKRLSIYRGKVIEPVVGSAGVLILPEAVKDLLNRAVLGFCNHSHVLRALGIDLKRGILLHGPPGTGKTSICLYLAGRLPQFTVCFASGQRLLYPREVCRMARYLQPAMIVFEDIDLVALERNANGLATVLGELMNQIDGCEPTDQVLFVMNTNSLDRLEHAVKNRPGRVDQIIDIPLPGRDERRKLLHHFAR